ncbi:MAG: DUF4389 domain-containing protein [Chloroflexi bacterium]|nr:DUF4389 domain-containing protein [Chloroflexota bacterium]
MPAKDAPHPVSFDVEYPERLSRLRTFFRLLLAIPQLIIAYLLTSLIGILAFIAWFSILFTGRYPKTFFEVSVGAMRWMANVVAYVALLRDEYPPFSWEPGDYSLTLDIERLERQSRFRLFIRYFAIFPNQIALYFMQLAWLTTTVIAWIAILVTGKYPRGLFRFGVGVMRWYQRQVAYLYLLRDEYPPYSINADARPGNEVASAIIGFPLFIGFIALSFLPFLGLLGTGTDTVAVQSALTSPQLRVEAPSGETNGIRLTILDYGDDALQPPGTFRFGGHRFVSFHVLAEKDGFLPTFFTPFFFRLHDQQGFAYFPEATSDGFEFEFFWRGGKTEGFVVFQIPRGARPADLIYQAGIGEIKFLFEPYLFD